MDIISLLGSCSSAVVQVWKFYESVAKEQKKILAYSATLISGTGPENDLSLKRRRTMTRPEVPARWRT